MKCSEEKLVKLLNYIAQHNDYYKKVIVDCSISNPLDITQYPILTKKEYQENMQLFISDDYRGKNYMNALYRLASSGTTGRPIETLWDPIQYDISILSLWRRRKLFYDISPTDKYICFDLKFFNKLDLKKLYYVRDRNKIAFSRISMRTPLAMDEFFKILNEYSPSWLQISPSIMEMLFDHYCVYKPNVPNSVRYIEFFCEVLTESTRNRAKAMFPNANIANMYGSEEMNCIAYECPFGNMHIIEENVYAECLTANNTLSPSGKGEIILTSLNNYATPLLRYNQGDCVEMTLPQKCQCGFTEKQIKKLIGRKTSVACINGINIDTCDVSDIMIIVQNHFGDPIRKYRIIYDEPSNTLLCYLVLIDKFVVWRNSICEYIQKLLFEKLGKIKISFIFRDWNSSSYKQDLFYVKKD